jgi:putative hemolysin
LQVVWADSEDDVRAAQRLRHLVFVEEMGALPTHQPGAPPGHDVDRFDAYCEHLLVRRADGGVPQVVGTYRVLTPANARRIGGYYSESEFDLTRLYSLRDHLFELGRACVHPQWRQGGVIIALWGALADFLRRHGMRTLIGCASVSLRDGGYQATMLWRQLSHTHAAPREWQVRPRLPLPAGWLGGTGAVDVPPLLRGYLRCGARVMGPAAWDPHFNTADLPLLLRAADLPRRFAAAGASPRRA